MFGLNKQSIVEKITGARRLPANQRGEAFAPSNIALVKYWGKRDDELNLPITPSLSISLGKLGTSTSVEIIQGHDKIVLNGLPVPEDTDFSVRLRSYLDLFRPNPSSGYLVNTHNTIPTAAGLASSASGFAALAMALDQLHGWKLPKQQLSILARLGSGSASRSVYTGFVEWHAGKAADGMDSFAEPVNDSFPSLMVGLIKISVAEKPLSSRAGMKRTVQTSLLYPSWPAQVSRDLHTIRGAIKEKNFDLLGQTAENNALTMHATALGAWPPVLFWLPESTKTMHKIWEIRSSGIPVYFTMDAGPNIKLLARKEDARRIDALIHGVEWIEPFA